MWGGMWPDPTRVFLSGEVTAWEWGWLEVGGLIEGIKQLPKVEIDKSTAQSISILYV